MTMADDAESTGEEICSTAVRYALVAAISREGSTPRRLTIRTGLQCRWARILGFRIMSHAELARDEKRLSGRPASAEYHPGPTCTCYE